MAKARTKPSAAAKRAKKPPAKPTRRGKPAKPGRRGKKRAAVDAELTRVLVRLGERAAAARPTDQPQSAVAVPFGPTPLTEAPTMEKSRPVNQNAFNLKKL